MLKKLKNRFLYPTVILYLLITLLGILSLIYPSLGYYEPVSFLFTFMYLLAFMSFITYFLNKNKGDADYEILLFSLINVACGTYLLISKYAEISSALGFCFILYTFFISINRLYKSYLYKKEKSPYLAIKLLLTIFIIFFGILVVHDLYSSITEAQSLLISFYMINFGFLSLAEVLIIRLADKNKLSKFFGNLDEKVVIGKKKDKNENVEELDKIVEEIEVTNKKRKNNKRKNK